MPSAEITSPMPTYRDFSRAARRYVLDSRRYTKLNHAPFEIDRPSPQFRTMCRAFRIPTRASKRRGNQSPPGSNVGSLLSESVESVAHKQDPRRGTEGIHDYGESEACYRNDSKDAGDQAQIGRGLVEDSPQHYETDHEDSEREGHYCIDDFQRGRQYCRCVVGSRDVTRPLDIIRAPRVVTVKNEHGGVMRPGDCQIQDDKQPHESCP